MTRISLCILLALCGAAQADDTITKNNSRHLPPAEVTRRTLDQLSHILNLPAYTATGPRPELPLSDLTFWTAPYETDTKNLCAVDEVTVKFRHTRPQADADTPVKAYSIEAVPKYHFAVLPASPEMQYRDEPSVDNPACTGLDPFNASTFEAASEETAWKGTWLLGEVARDAARADFAPHLKCLGSDTFPRECAAKLAALKPGNVGNISRCPDEEWVCYSFSFLDPSVDMEVYWVDHAGHPAIDHIVVHEILVMFDRRRD